MKDSVPPISLDLPSQELKDNCKNGFHKSCYNSACACKCHQPPVESHDPTTDKPLGYPPKSSYQEVTKTKGKSVESLDSIRDEIKRQLQVYRGWTRDEDAKDELPNHINSILTLIQTSNIEVLNLLADRLPGYPHHGHPMFAPKGTKPYSREYCLGYGDCLDDVKTVIEGLQTLTKESDGKDL